MLAEVMPFAIPLYSKQHEIRAYALVDADDWIWVRKHTWTLDNGGYAYRLEYLGGGRAAQRRRAIKMHREITGLVVGEPLEVDHLNGVRLDNRRCNLRVCTRAENAQNVNRPGRMRGATLHAQSGRWRARVKVDGREVSGGLYATPEEAARAAADLRRRYLPFSQEARHAVGSV